jgi:hypothetical protein
MVYTCGKLENDEDDGWGRTEELDEVVVTGDSQSDNSNGENTTDTTSDPRYDNPDDTDDGDWDYDGGETGTSVSGGPDFHVDNQLTGKADCVYRRLEAAYNNLFKKTIGKFVKDPEYNLTLKNGNCQGAASACTNGDDVNTTGEVYITIAETDISSMTMAATILHEGIHAELYRYIAQYKKGINPNDKKEVFRYYKYYAERYGDVFADKPKGKGAIDHIYMTQHYINPIASALRDLDGKRYPLDYYKSFTWDGLREWDPNNTLKMEDNTTYGGYRKTVDANSKICKN